MVFGQNSLAKTTKVKICPPSFWSEGGRPLGLKISDLLSQQD